MEILRLSMHICTIFSTVKSTFCCLVQSNVTYQSHDDRGADFLTAPVPTGLNLTGSSPRDSCKYFFSLVSILL
jgi:hypothetical protein